MNFCDSVSQNQGLKLALAQLRGSALAAMPFSEDDMFSPWSPSNDGRIVGDYQCIQDMSENNMNQQSQSQMQQPQSSTHQQNNQNQDLSNCDLTNLESLTCNDSDELLRQLTENTFELETFFSEFSTADIKEENNNDVIDSTNQDNFSNCNDINVEANLAILQNRLLASASSKFGINLIRGELAFPKFQF